MYILNLRSAFIRKIFKNDGGKDFFFWLLENNFDIFNRFSIPDHFLNILSEGTGEKNQLIVKSHQCWYSYSLNFLNLLVLRSETYSKEPSNIRPFEIP